MVQKVDEGPAASHNGVFRDVKMRWRVDGEWQWVLQWWKSVMKDRRRVVME